MPKVAIFLAVMVLTGILVEDVQAGWFRRVIKWVGRKFRPVIKTVIKPICRWAYPKVCRRIFNNRWVCRFGCKKLCGRKRREITAVADRHVSPISSDFYTYDLNEDGKISIMEFACIMGEDSDAEDIKEVFKIADTDGDKCMSMTELYNGPFFFARNNSDDDKQGDDTGNQVGDNGNQENGTESQSAETTTPAEEKKRM